MMATSYGEDLVVCVWFSSALAESALERCRGFGECIHTAVVEVED
jgi:hypothetical protein